METNARLQESQRKLPSESRRGGAVCPARNRAEQAEHKVLGPSGPGPLPEHSSERTSHQPHLQVPESQKRLCPPSAPIVSNWRVQRSHTYLPSSVTSGGPVWPFLNLLLHAEHSVFGPSGPGPFPEQSPYLHLHQLHRHVPASQKRLCPPRAPIESNTREHASHTYFPSAFFPGGPVWPFLKRLLQAEQSVLGPSGPGPLPEHSSFLH
mmetsp:Transcript_25937/g.78877  ORF Transcript_25937/g.78877 Transcript_25937/m.78877 type:complete len:208 (-) Transcript_25937:701-1324(-)